VSIIDGNLKDISFFNNIHFSNQVINLKNKELPIKEVYYNLFKLQSFKNEELLENNKNEIPIITNSSKSYSIPKRNIRKINKMLYTKNVYTETNKNDRVKNNLQLKVVPSNFKCSKKIQVNNNFNN
jgi:hypothetical protein